MIDNKELDCKIYVEANLASSELAGLLARALSGTMVGPDFAPIIQLNGCELEVRPNDEADAVRAQDFPDGFLFFRHALELYAPPGLRREERIELTAKLLRTLWSQGFPAVAACHYEKELPSGGGYNSRPYPWLRAEKSAEVPSSRAV